MAFLSALGVFWAQPYRPLVFDGNSMSPTYADHEIVWTVPFDGHLRRGDVVVVQTPLGRMVKRVRFLPGDRIPQFWEGGGWTDLVYLAPPRSGRRLRYFEVPPRRLFVTGDNVLTSVDSRTYGLLPFSAVERKAIDPRPNRARPHSDCLRVERTASAASGPLPYRVNAGKAGASSWATPRKTEVW